MLKTRYTGQDPELTVAAVVEQAGRYLLVEERVAGQLVLNQPAGHVEPGESLTTAVIREALEETAWVFEPEAIIGVYLWGREGSLKPFLRVAYTGRCTRHDSQRPLDAGIERVLWLPRAELLARHTQLRSPMVLRVIDDFERGLRYPVEPFQALGIDELRLRAAVL